MTEDELLIERIHPLLDGHAGFSGKKMFESVCFLINGNMCLGTWKGSLSLQGRALTGELVLQPL